MRDPGKKLRGLCDDGCPVGRELTQAPGGNNESLLVLLKN
jgi:hypothetical protein